MSAASALVFQESLASIWTGFLGSAGQLSMSQVILQYIHNTKKRNEVKPSLSYINLHIFHSIYEGIWKMSNTSHHINFTTLKTIEVISLIVLLGFAHSCKCIPSFSCMQCNANANSVVPFLP